jgi:virulence-associated protein E
MKPIECLSLCPLRADLGDEVKIATTDDLKKNPQSTAVARTAENLTYRAGEPAFALFDFDTKEMPDAVARRIEAAGGYWGALVSILPGLAGAAHAIRPSTSSGLSNAEIGKTYPGSAGKHAYVEAEDGGDIKRFLYAAHDRAWLAGFGWYALGADGRPLERSIVDRMVGLDGRLVFEGRPIVEPPLRQDAASRRPEVFPGGRVDTRAVCPSLTTAESQKKAALLAEDARRIEPERRRVRDAYVERRVEKLRARGLTIPEARVTVEKWIDGGILTPEFILPFDDEEIGGRTVENVLDAPEMYEGLTLADPIEGVAYGRGKATIIIGDDGRFGFLPRRDFFITVVLDAVRHNSFHPVLNYLGGLTWDGVERLDRWLVTYGGAEDTNYVRAVGGLALIAAVRRVRKPGCKFDEMLILENPQQGTDKSTALKVLAVREKWFSDDLPLHSDGKRVIEQTRGKWIVEASDLSGMRRSDVEHLKATLSRTSDRARLSYDRLTTERQRQFVVIGTTNAAHYLRDTTGNRRYWPVRVKRFDLDALTRDRDQLWAEAATREAAGALIRLDPSLWTAAGEEQEERTVDDPWLDVVKITIGDLDGKILNADAWAIVRMPEDRRTQEHNGRLGNVMKLLGFERKSLQFGGEKHKGYVRGQGDDREKRIYVHKTFDDVPYCNYLTPEENRAEEQRRLAEAQRASAR